ncbi:hypothetical protein [Halobellus inordinatus]|uniref:hypothetical protein n=1 Tax=Halobellus inordinatus TaxID=1126236 RepID=UPI00210B4B15|nr:hypothetical protein [Halobellus inordinatus]
MSGRVAKASIEDDDLLEALEAAEDEHGSMAEALRHALRTTYAGEDDADDDVSTGLPKAAREGYEALREHVNPGERLALDAAEGIIAQRVQLRKPTVRDTVIRKLHAAGWIDVEQGIHRVGIIVRSPVTAGGGHDDDRDAGDVLDETDDVDVGEAEARLDELAAATPGGESA